MVIDTIDLHFLGLERSIAAFLVQGPAGYALVECGPHSVFQPVAAKLADKGLTIKDIQAVFLTHIHFDHAGAAWAFAEAGAMIYVHPVGLPHLAAPEKLYNSARQIYGDRMDELWGRMEPISEERLYAAEHGEVIEAVGLRFRAWHTPGHATHHIAWEVGGLDAPNGDVVFTGDVAGVRISESSPVMPPCPPPDIHIGDWQHSIQLLRDLVPTRLILTHFGEISDKAAHLDALETRLLAWAAWMRPYAERKDPIETIIPLFTAYVKEELVQAGVDAEGLARYEASNPAFMSVAGLMRYWKKNLPQ